MDRSKLILRTAASALAAAIYEVFPGSELLGGGDTTTGFFYQFFSSYPLPPEARHMLEEKMRQIVRENREVREMEMVACSAKQFFEKEGHIAAVDALEEFEPKELVSIVKIGRFSDLMEGPFCTTVREVGAFKLTALQTLGDCEYRVEGCACATKEQLKDFLRILSHYETANHLRLGSNLGLWSEEGEQIIWMSRGLAVRQRMINFLQKSLGSEEYKGSTLALFDQYGLKRARCDGAFSAWTVAEKTFNPEGEQGFFEEEAQTTAQQIIYCKEGEILEFATSLLQRIRKTLIILSFNPELCLAGRKQSDKGVKLLSYLLSNDELGIVAGNSSVPFDGGNMNASQTSQTSRISTIRWMVRDGLGRLHAAMELEIEYTEDRFAILRGRVGIERIIALLLEKSSGILPDWLILEPN